MCVCFIATRGTLQHVSACKGHLQVIFLPILEQDKTRLGIPVFIKILPEDGPYRPKHVVMIQV
jgi:hypothetical protein